MVLYHGLYQLKNKNVCTKYLPQLKEEILSRDGKLVIRPDSGDPVDIICGVNPEFGYTGEKDIPQNKGVIELLWNTFGGTINEKGYKVLDPHIGAIYGDSITMDRAIQICERLKAKGFASTNIVLGIGSYTYQYNTRDTFGFAMKATYGELVNKCGCKDKSYTNGQVTGSSCCDRNHCIEPREIFKDPITDDGTKKSKKGLLHVWQNRHGELICRDQVSKHDEEHGLLKTVFKNGKLVKETTLEEIRERLK